ncbi:hypothetical protein B7Y94_01140 [Candidatus Saccharibacteria bacterium 32-49-12]|nr:MAG: hypothetical protein B7Y94_01140 [Candidatus Saccharibacteria bacterium 32-49-12]
MAQRIPVIGRTVLIDLIGHATKVPAKVDTGADRSSVWATDVHVDKDGLLSFVLFGPESDYYTGEVIQRKNYKFSVVRSSNGHAQIRYRVQFSVRIGAKRIKAIFTLADRSANTYPILLGRRTLHKKFVVDVARAEVELEVASQPKGLKAEFLKNPAKFHKKYHLKAPR